MTDYHIDCLGDWWWNDDEVTEQLTPNLNSWLTTGIIDWLHDWPTNGRTDWQTAIPSWVAGWLRKWTDGMNAGPNGQTIDCARILKYKCMIILFTFILIERILCLSNECILRRFSLSHVSILTGNIQLMESLPAVFWQRIVGKFVCALSRVNHDGLHQGWRRLSWKDI